MEEFLSIQILKAISKEHSNDLRFVIYLDDTKDEESKTNSDEIMIRWILPEKTGKPIDLKSVCSCLVTPNNEIPLWIKIKKNNEIEAYEIFISKRFRKISVIKEWHKNNEFMPVLLDERLP